MWALGEYDTDVMTLESSTEVQSSYIGFEKNKTQSMFQGHFVNNATSGNSAWLI